MLVYRSAARVDDARCFVDALRAQVEQLACAGSLTKDECVDLLLGAAELETGLVDGRCRERDDVDPVIGGLRRVTRTAAAALVAARHGRGESARASIVRLRELLRDVDRAPFDTTITCPVPEGYAHYALYPEMYIDAAEQFARVCHPDAATVIGIRTIGTSLSAVVAATLAARGIDVRDATVRPRGHPYDRHLVLGPRLAALLRERVRGWFVIVDEGPGISGSSFSAVALALETLGVERERVVFLPSWLPDPDSLRNDAARARWRSHQKFVGSFERVWIESGALEHRWNARLVADWSGGQWRQWLMPRAIWPAVQPQHEHRKYLLERRDGERLLLKFNGLGRYGASRTCAARHLAARGLAPRVLAAAGGFLATEFIDAVPLTRSDLSSEDLAHVGRYIASRPAATDSNASATSEELAEMIRVNVCELVDAAHADRAAGLARAVASHRSGRRILVDGRLQPHEWIRSRAGDLLKTDGAAHHDDHFYPGAQDPAWDIAGACVELCDGVDQRRHVIDAYVEASGDASIEERLPYWLLAYSAFRGGYTRLAAQTLGDLDDAPRMRDLVPCYVAEIRRVLAETEAA